MPRPKRAEVFSADEICVVHAMQRCVRQMFLTGVDPVSGQSYEHRREWIRHRLELLASVFSIDVLTYAVMSNHLHVMLRTRPDVVRAWSDREVAIRWLRLFPGRRLDEYLADTPNENDIAVIVNNPEKLMEVRRRLSDVSWFMRSLAEPIARMANKQDQVVGRFWEGRFRAQRIVDEAGLLACAMYVDLNPVRAAMHLSPEESLFTGAFDRIQSLRDGAVASTHDAIDAVSVEAVESSSRDPRKHKETADTGSAASQVSVGHTQEPAIELKRPHRDSWLAPLTIQEKGPLGPHLHTAGCRASDKGFLAMSLKDYLTLLDWTGREGRVGKKGTIPASLVPILSRLGIEASAWCDLVWGFKRYFGRSRALGSPQSMHDYGSHSPSRQRVMGQSHCRECFVLSS